MNEKTMTFVKLKKFKLNADRWFGDCATNILGFANPEFEKSIQVMDTIEIDPNGHLWEGSGEINRKGFSRMIRQIGYLLTDSAIDFKNVKQMYRSIQELNALGGYFPRFVGPEQAADQPDLGGAPRPPGWSTWSST